MSTVAEIREAISHLNEQDRLVLLGELFSEIPEPDENDPELRATLERGIADDDADRVYTTEEVRALIPQWITRSPTPKAP